LNVLIVQPWFAAIGHPAQSLLHTARALGARSGVGYLIAEPRGAELAATADEIARYGPVERFASFGASLRGATLLSLPAVLRVARRETQLQHVFFLDADLVALAAGWPLLWRSDRRRLRVSAIYLGGPERIASHPLARALVRRFLAAAGRRLYLRTPELCQAWRSAFAQLPAERIDTIPSLELQGAARRHAPRRDGTDLRFGVIGQVRPGKSLEWLVPLFERDAKLGTLHIAGTFTNATHESRLAFLSGYAHFDNRYLTEAQMLAAAADQDYLLALYDDWDARMEAAIAYLAARVGKPVIVYDEGWLGRVVREFGSGIAVSRQPAPDARFFRVLPRPGHAQYQALLDGIQRFRAAYGGPESRAVFLGKLFDA